MSKRTANLILISSHAEVFPIVPCAPQLACVNRKISERVTDSSNAHVHAIFAEAEFLAGKAIEAATELQRMPGMSAAHLLKRWTFGAASATMPVVGYFEIGLLKRM